MLFVNSIKRNKQDKRYILAIPQTSQDKKSFNVNFKKILSLSYICLRFCLK